MELPSTPLVMASLQTQAGRGLRASPDHDDSEPIPAAELRSTSQRHCCFDDDKRSFAPAWIGIARVDIATRQVQMSRKDIMCRCKSGRLYFYKDSLIAFRTRRSSGPGDALLLESRRKPIQRAKSSRSTIPSLMCHSSTLVGDSLFFAANPQLDKRKQDGSTPSHSEA